MSTPAALRPYHYQLHMYGMDVQTVPVLKPMRTALAININHGVWKNTEVQLKMYLQNYTQCNSYPVHHLAVPMMIQTLLMMGWPW